MTPAIDDGDSILEASILENRARDELEKDGCYPCYPAHLELPLDNVPEEYRSIIQYWKAQPGVQCEVLCAQLQDWRRFRAYQARMRRLYGRDRFNRYIERLRKSMLHAEDFTSPVEGEVANQSRLQDWVEFGHYHLENLEDLRELFRKAEAGLQNVATASEEDLAALQNHRDYQKRLLRQQESMVNWIERKKTTIRSAHLVQQEAQKAARARARHRSARSGKRKDHGKISLPKVKKFGQVSRSITGLLEPSPPRLRAGKAHQALHRSRQQTTYSELYKTRSGRVSRPPLRWIPL